MTSRWRWAGPPVVVERIQVADRVSQVRGDGKTKEEPASLPALRSWRRWWNEEGVCGLGGNWPGDRWHATEWSFKEGG